MSQPTPIQKTVLVLGSAPEAECTSQELLALGYDVRQVASEALTGGPTGAMCFSDVDITALAGQIGSYRLRIVDEAGQAAYVDGSAVVVATGNERYYPAKRYGIPQSPTVLSLAQIGARLNEPRSTRQALPYRNLTVAIVLDWGGVPTSRETASEALRTAIRLRDEWHCEVVLFYRDLRVDSPGFEALTREMRQRGVLFSRYGDGATISADLGGVTIRYIEGQLNADLLVLPEVVRPRADTAALAKALNVHLGEDGYFEDVNIHQVRSGISNRRGIFFAGRCYMECDPEDALNDALQAAANVDALLGAGYLEPEPVVAYVDSGKCIRCLTCVRTCPHAAVEVAEYAVEGDSVVAALVAELACQGCGACVSNCPVRAIELVGQALPAWMQAIPTASA